MNIGHMEARVGFRGGQKMQKTAVEATAVMIIKIIVMKTVVMMIICCLCKGTMTMMAQSIN